jgi:hypothetical protein
VRSIYSYTDEEEQVIDVYFIDGNVGITLRWPDHLDERDGPIVWLTPAQAQKLSDALRGVAAV